MAGLLSQFINKLLLEYSHVYSLRYPVAAFTAQPQNGVVVTETIWSQSRKHLLTDVLERRSPTFALGFTKDTV